MLHKTLVVILLSFPIAISALFIEVPEEVKLGIRGLVRTFGRTVEEYDVTTADGYILKLFRIPGDRTRPVLMVHGLLSSADDFVARGNESLSATLSDAGYDLWLMNYRGNRHSRRHVTLNPDTDRSFWEFGAHHHGYYDLPTSIDFVLNQTGETQLSLLTNSLGGFITYILFSSRPEYNDKINVYIGLAPSMHLHYIKERMPFIERLGRIARSVMFSLKIDEILSRDSVTGAIIRLICSHIVGLQVCRHVLLLTSGYNAEGFESDFIPSIFWNAPAGTSSMTLDHLFQILVNKRFANYDYGPAKNLEKYGSKVAPAYDLKKISMNVTIIGCVNDNLATLRDHRRQARELPNVKEYIVIDQDLFSHLDFIYSRKSNILVHPKVLDILKKYN